MELENTSNWIRITVELPDRSLDDVHVSIDGASIHVRAAASEESTQTNGIERTIALAENVDAAGAAVTYCDPTLTVLVPKREPA